MISMTIILADEKGESGLSPSQEQALLHLHALLLSLLLFLRAFHLLLD